MMSEGEIRRFREGFIARQKFAKGNVGICSDGPLKGLSVRVDDRTWRTPGATWSYSDYSYKESKWSVKYTHAEQVGRWKLVEVRGDARKNFETTLGDRAKEQKGS